MKSGRKRTIGSREWVSLPEWGLQGIEAKIDTGAFTSSLDVESALVLPGRGGDPAQVLITLREEERRKTVTAKVAGVRTVRNPSGGVTSRPIVETVLVLGGRRFRTLVNLHRREGMSYRMIIGRRALAGRFVVDVARRSGK